MKIRSMIILAGVAMAALPVANAKQQIQAWPIADVMNNPEYMKNMNGVTFLWGNELQGEAVATSNVERVTTGVLKSDKEACERALVDALEEMRLHALQRGAHSVQAIKSTVTGAPYASDSEYLCLTGHTNSRVFIQGKIVMNAPDQVNSPTQRASQPIANYEQREATPRPVSTPKVDPQQEDLYGTPWN